jgi:hypothetical protein
LILGAWALGGGFLAEQLAGDYDLQIADISPRAEILHRPQDEQDFTVNLCGQKVTTARLLPSKLKQQG